MNAERPFLLRTIAALVEGDGDDVLPLSPERWQALESLAHAGGMAPLLYRAVQRRGLSSRLPPEILQKLRAIYYHTAAVNALLGRELGRIVRAVERLPNPPSLVVLKGAALIPLLYEDMALRPLQDIDLLVAPQNVERVTAVLTDLGYEEMPLWDQVLGNVVEHHRVFHLSENAAVPLTVELHWHLLSGSHPARDAFRDWFWAHVEAPPPAGDSGEAGFFHLSPSVWVPSPTAHLLHLIVHLGVQHDLPSARLVWFYDAHRLVQRFGARVAWPELIRQVKRHGWEEPFATVVTITRALFDTPWPAETSRIKGIGTSSAEKLLAQVGAVPTRLKGVRREWRELPWHLRARYLVRKLVPSGEYMRWRYRPHPEPLWPLWYLYRWSLAAREAARLAWNYVWRWRS